VVTLAIEVRRTAPLNVLHSGSGGPSGQMGRTVRTGHTDCPHTHHGPSEKANRTSRDDPE
jgi:hypothetical protein